MFSRISLRRDLGVQLLAIYLLFVAPVVLGALTFDHFAAQRLDADVKAADLALAQAIAQETNTVLDNALQAVRQLAAYPAVVEADPTGMQEIFQVVMSARSDINLIYRLDADGKVIAHPDPAMLLTDARDTLPSVMMEVLSGHKGNQIGRDFEGTETLYSYVPVSSVSWGVVVSHPTASAFATQRAFHRGTLAAIGVFLAFGLMFWLALARQVLRPLEQLATFSQRIGLEPGTPPDQNAELAALAERTDQMGHLIRSLTRMEEAIRARFEELSTLLHTSAAVGCYYDAPHTWSETEQEVMQAFARQAALALENARLFESLQARLGELSALAEASAALRGAETTQEIAQRLVADAARLTGADAGLLCLVDETRQRIVTQGAIGLPPEAVGREHGREEGIAGQVIRTGAVYRSPDLAHDPLAAQADRRHAETLRDAAAALASTLELDSLLNRVLQELQKVVPYDSASVQLLRDDQLEIIAGRGFPEPDKVIGLTFPVAGDNPNKEVIARKRPLLVPDAYAAYAAFKEAPHSHIRSWLGAPLLARDRVIGMITLDRTEVNAFSAEELDIAMTFANHVAIALENARLYARAERRADQLRALRVASRTLTSDLRLEVVLQTLAETARHLTNARYAALVVPNTEGELIQFQTAGLAEAERQRIGEPPRGRGLLGIPLREGVPIRVADLARDPRATGFPPYHPVMKTFMGVPILTPGKVLGSLYLTDKMDAQPFTREDEDLVLGLAADAAIAIENARLFGKVERLAATDGLTGLYNVRYFYQALEKELERSRRYGHPCSLIMLDLDDFKKYNDRYGHLAGDDLLRELADLIRSTTRETDTAARYGGEEFVVILPETNGDQAVALAERLRETVREHKFVVREGQRLGRITVSLGVATYPGGAQDVEGLVEAADMALLQAKERKDRVCVAANLP